MRKLKGSDVFINEHLAKKNGEIAQKDRLLRRQGKIKTTWTRDCKELMKTIGVPEVDKIHQTKNMTDFVDLMLTLVIIMVIFKCYFSGEHIALSINKNNNGVNIA